eukprot:Skav222494  [mRNA]  locus=scaffold1835:453666:474268:- [translate_table: standard]
MMDGDVLFHPILNPAAALCEDRSGSGRSFFAGLRRIAPGGRGFMADQLNLNATTGFRADTMKVRVAGFCVIDDMLLVLACCGIADKAEARQICKDKPSKQPGPGEYPQVKSEKDKFGKTPSWSIGGASKGGKDWAPMPGPGAYTPSNPDFVSPKWGFTNDNRLKPNKMSKTPGPGQYELKSTLQGPGFPPVCHLPDFWHILGEFPWNSS